jgi:hypothetical protein
VTRRQASEPQRKVGRQRGRSKAKRRCCAAIPDGPRDLPGTGLRTAGASPIHATRFSSRSRRRPLRFHRSSIRIVNDQKREAPGMKTFLKWTAYVLGGIVGLLIIEWWIVAAYLIGCFALAVHLVHGFQSAFQTLGIQHKKYTPLIFALGWIYSVVVPVGFAIIPLYHFFLR